MSFEEKNTWIYVVITIGAFTAYLVTILGRADGIPLHEVAYVAPLLWTIGGAVIAAIVGTVAISIAWPKDADKRDERDKEINRFGEYIGQSFVVIGALAALILSMVEADHFWIAHAVYVSFVLSALLASTAKIVAYRRGF